MREQQEIPGSNNNGSHEGIFTSKGRLAKWWFGISLGIIVLNLSSLVLWGKDAIVPVRDILDGWVPMLKVLAHSGKMSSSSGELMPVIMNGLPRSCYGSELNVLVWLYYIFDDFTAYVLNMIILHFTAFLSMFVFLRNHVAKDKEMGIVVISVSLLFALLPFYPFLGLGIAGMPLLANAFFNLRAGRGTWADWLVVVLMPFYSSLPIVGFFVIASLCGILVVDVVRTKTLPFRFASAIAIHSVLNIIVEYRLFLSMIVGEGLVSHRVERLYQTGSTIYNVLEGFRQMLVNGQFHAASIHAWLIPVVVVAIAIGLWKGRDRKETRILIGLAAAIIGVALFHAFWFWKGLDGLKGGITILRTFQFDRFYMLNPILWYTLLALSLMVFVTHLGKIGKYIVIVVIVVQGVVLLRDDLTSIPLREKIKSLAGKKETPILAGLPTYRQYYSEAMFRQIRDHIGKPQESYRVVSIGICPAVSQYNNFYTLDGYMGNYPLEYKHRFRKIIESELAKSNEFRKDYDYWGSQVNVVVSELGPGQDMIPKNSSKAVKNMQLNTDVLKEMNCQFVFSAVPLENAAANHMEFVKLFEDQSSYWRIFLYKLI